MSYSGSHNQCEKCKKEFSINQTKCPYCGSKSYYRKDTNYTKQDQILNENGLYRFINGLAKFFDVLAVLSVFLMMIAVPLLDFEIKPQQNNIKTLVIIACSFVVFLIIRSAILSFKDFLKEKILNDNRDWFDTTYVDEKHPYEIQEKVLEDWGETEEGLLGKFTSMLALDDRDCFDGELEEENKGSQLASENNTHVENDKQPNIQSSINEFDDCKNGNHPFEIVDSTLVYKGLKKECKVVRWCPKCGAIVVDHDVDGVTKMPGHYKALDIPTLSRQHNIGNKHIY